MQERKVAIVDHVGVKAGMEAYDLALFHALRKKGCTATVYSNIEANDNEIFKSFRFEFANNILSLVRLVAAYHKISNIIRKRQFTHCIVHGFRFGFVEWLMIQTLIRSRTKIFMIVHDPENLLNARNAGAWKQKIFKACTALVVHNNFSAEELIRHLGNDQRKVQIIPHGNFLDIVRVLNRDQLLEKYSFEPGRKYILFFGQIKESKGLEILLQAMAKVEKDIQLIIAGRMRHHGFEKYNSLIEMLQLKGRIKLLPGYIPTEVRNELFQMADAVVLPYKKVYQSGVMLMGMSYGKAVIASDLPPNKEIIIDNENGILFQSGNVDSLSFKINNVMQDNSKRNKVAANGRSFVEVKHNWNSIAEKWINLFK